MYRENIFLKIITYAPLIFVPLLVGIVLLITVETYNNSFQESLKNTEENFYKIEKKALESKIESISDLIIHKKSMVKKELTSHVKNRVNKAYSIATSLYEKYRDTKSEEEIKEMIKTSLGSMIWNAGESFIWIVDYEGNFDLAPDYLKHLEGSSIINFQDATGRYVIQEEIALVKERGEGLLWDTFTKPNDSSGKQYKQVAFVKDFEHYNWYFGSGEYIDTATKKADKKLINSISKIDDIDSHYIFLLKRDGTVLINKTSQGNIGKNISQMKNPKEKRIVEEILESVKGREKNSLTYQWKNPKTNKFEEKYTFVQHINNTDWVIGSGFYLSSIEDKLLQEKTDIRTVFSKKAKDIIYVSILMIFIALIISYYITKKLRKSFKDYEKHIESKNMQFAQLNDTLEIKVQERTAELEEMKDNLEVLATTDILTNMHNRYSLMKILESEIRRAHRYKTPLSIIMYDIDFFKKVNDTYGHDVGDSILSALSKFVQDSLRDTDIVARYGGEEFVIILPNTTLKDAKYFANRLRVEVQNYSFESVGELTISLGLAELDTNEDIDMLFKRVDNLLYKSKKDGRNRYSA